MDIRVFLVLLTNLIYVISNSLKKFQNFSDLVYEKTGNVTIVGVFEGFAESDCHLRSDKSLEEMASAIWIVETLNKYEYLTGLTIGLSIFERCGNGLKIENEFLDRIEENNRIDSKAFAGVLTTIKTTGRSKPFGKASTTLIRVKHMVNEVTLIDLIIQFLINSQWMVVDTVFTDSVDILNLFVEKATSEGVYAYNQLLVNESSGNSSKNSSLTDGSEVIIIMAESQKITNFLKNNKDSFVGTNMSALILAPTDFNFQPPEDLPQNTLMFMPAIGNKDVLKQFVTGSECHKDFFNHREPTKSPLFLGVAIAILKLLIPYKNIKEECTGASYDGEQPVSMPCQKPADFTNFNSENETDPFVASKLNSITEDDIGNAFDKLKLDLNSNNEMFLYLAYQLSGTRSTAEEVAIFQLFNVKTKSLQPVLLKINVRPRLNEAEIIGEPEEKKRFPGVNFDKKPEKFSRAENSNLKISFLQGLTNSANRDLYELSAYRNYSNSSIPVHFFAGKNGSFQSSEKVLRNRTNEFLTSSTWVMVNATLGFIGFLCVLFILGLVVRMNCRGDPLEGSQIFIILLMLAVSFVFMTSLCYHFVVFPYNQRFLCFCRTTILPFAYSFLFALMFSRGILLAFSEYQKGFVSHVNGYLQFILFLCLLGIQIAFTSQAWMYENGSKQIENCTEDKLITNQIYNCILVGLLVCVGPFIIRFQRNYREGLLLALSAFAIAVVWCAWIACYYYLSTEYNDPVIAFGLNGTGLVIVIFALVPRAYLMIIATVHGRTTRISSRAPKPFSEVSDVHYKSRGIPELSGCTEFPVVDDLNETFKGVLNPNFIQ